MGQGDTLYSIARRYSTSVQALQSANSLQGTRLSIGKILRLPPGSRPGSRVADSPPRTGPMPEWPLGGISSPFVIEQAQPGTSASDIVEAQHSDPLDSTASGSDAGYDAAAVLKRFQLVNTGFGYLGIRYRWNGASEKTGFDCSGLVAKLFDQLGISLPRSAREQFRRGVEVASVDLEPGDLVFFGGRSRIPTHVGIYVGERCILHAQSGSRRVTVSDLENAWYKRRFLGARRIPELWADSAVYDKRQSADGTH